MRILMLNGSPRPNGNTFIALSEIGKQLKEEGIDYEIFQTMHTSFGIMIPVGKIMNVSIGTD